MVPVAPVAVGERLVVRDAAGADHVAVTVADIVDPTEGATDGSATTPGLRLIGISFLIEDPREADGIDVYPAPFSMIQTDGFGSGWDLAVPAEQDDWSSLTQIRLTAGESTTGTLIFAVSAAGASRPCCTDRPPGPSWTWEPLGSELWRSQEQMTYPDRPVVVGAAGP